MTRCEIAECILCNRVSGLIPRILGPLFVRIKEETKAFD